MEDPIFSKFTLTSSNNLANYNTSLPEKENKINFSSQEESKTYNQYPIINDSYNIDINSLNNNYISYININNDINKINIDNLIQESSNNYISSENNNNYFSNEINYITNIIENNDINSINNIDINNNIISDNNYQNYESNNGILHPITIPATFSETTNKIIYNNNINNNNFINSNSNNLANIKTSDISSLTYNENNNIDVNHYTNYQTTQINNVLELTAISSEPFQTMPTSKSEYLDYNININIILI